MTIEAPLLHDRNDVLERQYPNSDRLKARAELHRRFSTAARPWHQWIFDQMTLGQGDQVLECGCGPGWLWRQNRVRIPSGLGTVILTDLSPGMVDEAMRSLGRIPTRFQGRVADMQDLPFETGRFDLVVANHVLHHLREPDRALSEVRRVLRTGGRFLAAASGENHMREIYQLAPGDWPPKKPDLADPHAPMSAAWLSRFRLENGLERISGHFSNVRFTPYPDRLEVTEVDALLKYYDSLPDLAHSSGAARPDREALRSRLKCRLEREGAIPITVETGLFSAW